MQDNFKIRLGCASHVPASELSRGPKSMTKVLMGARDGSVARRSACLLVKKHIHTDKYIDTHTPICTGDSYEDTSRPTSR